MKDVLILERDELVGTVLADILLEEGISAAIVSEQEAKQFWRVKTRPSSDNRYQPRSSRRPKGAEAGGGHAPKVATALRHLPCCTLAGASAPRDARSGRAVSPEAGSPHTADPHGTGTTGFGLVWPAHQPATKQTRLAMLRARHSLKSGSAAADYGVVNPQNHDGPDHGDDQAIDIESVTGDAPE